MAKYEKAPVVIEAFTWDEFIQVGIDEYKKDGSELNNGLPWSFTFKGFNVTHENDECYLIPTLEGTMNFTPEDMIMVGVNGEIYPCKKEIFNKTYRGCGTVLQRLINESHDLDEKIEKLKKALDEKKIPSDMVEINKEQLEIMGDYLEIVKEKIDYINHKEDDNNNTKD